jgi:hypothetical protein
MVNESLALSLRQSFYPAVPQLLESCFREVNVSFVAIPLDLNILTHALDVDVAIEKKSSITYGSDMFAILSQPVIQNAKLFVGKCLRRR